MNELPGEGCQAGTCTFYPDNSSTRRHPDDPNFSTGTHRSPNDDMSRKGRGATNRIELEISMTEDDERMEGKEQGWRRITNWDYTNDIDDSTDFTYRARRFVQTYRSYIAIRSTTHDRLSYPDAATRNGTAMNGTADDTGARTDVDMDWKEDRNGEANAVR
ncbi:uncharacterized protein FIESC28_07655 [Fusarium coffeatum]|uniref:Uncharacterized protein n=1 Tax=Fusarium coffeatum TaxID=231269 RepID=A0A366RDX2_9HYPO|nr:uncharacterized protein FIESC28_07655 [Fusarium coffeatum]RBR14526.1 hypothetical protein FIESC28_07655 [Fusarium coffeatum]